VNTKDIPLNAHVEVGPMAHNEIPQFIDRVDRMQFVETIRHHGNLVTGISPRFYETPYIESLGVIHDDLPFNDMRKRFSQDQKGI
jgi:hypothetical protein